MRVEFKSNFAKINCLATKVACCSQASQPEFISQNLCGGERTDSLKLSLDLHIGLCLHACRCFLKFNTESIPGVFILLFRAPVKYYRGGLGETR